jgi:hypothetical protein
LDRFGMISSDIISAYVTDADQGTSHSTETGEHRAGQWLRRASGTLFPSTARKRRSQNRPRAPSRTTGLEPLEKALQSEGLNTENIPFQPTAIRQT